MSLELGSLGFIKFSILTLGLADLETVMNKKLDTSEADALRKELQALKDQHQASLMTAQQESAKATEEHLAAKAALEKAQAELGRQKAESVSDYKDMHEVFQIVPSN